MAAMMEPLAVALHAVLDTAALDLRDQVFNLTGNGFEDAEAMALAGPKAVVLKVQLQ